MRAILTLENIAFETMRLLGIRPVNYYVDHFGVNSCCVDDVAVVWSYAPYLDFFYLTIYHLDNWVRFRTSGADLTLSIDEFSDTILKPALEELRASERNP